MSKQDQERQVIHLYLKESDEHHYFGSISALYEHYTQKQLGIAIQTLYNQFKSSVYDNNKVVIRKGRLVQKKHLKLDNTVK